jgi:SCY1-like protein 2
MHTIILLDCFFPGARVEKEHMQYLKDSQRIEDRSGGLNGSLTGTGVGSTGVDFESLVGGSASIAKTTSTSSDSSSKGWDDDVWGSILADTPVQVSANFPCYRAPDPHLFSRQRL